MRRLGYILAALLLLGGIAHAQAQGWQADQDGMNFSAYDVGSFSANNLTAGGPLVSVASTGEIVNGVIPGATVYADGVHVGTIQLASLSAASYSDGTVAWVQSVGDYYRLGLSALTTTPLTVVTASGKSGYQWLRLGATNLDWQAVGSWHVDPVNGSDEAAGTGTGASALKTCAEWTRRLTGAHVGFITLTLDNDIPDADTIVVPFDGSFLTIAGSQTVVSTQTIASALARNPATNQSNDLTVTGFSWSPFVGQLLRVQGTANYAAITKDLGGNTARVSELINASGIVAAAGGITAAQVVEIVTTRKGPLQLQVKGNIPVFLEDVRLDGSGVAGWQNPITPVGGSSIALRSIFRGNAFNLSTPVFMQFWGCLVSSSFILPPGEYRGTAFTASGSLQSTIGSVGYYKLRSTVFQAAALTLAQAILHVDADFGQFDLPAAAIGINANGSGVGEGSMIRFNSGRHYGSGNDATSHVWSVGIGTQVSYLVSSPPTMNAGLGVTMNGTDYALSSLPIQMSLAFGNEVSPLGGSVAAGIVAQNTAGTTFPRTLVSTGGTIAVANGDGAAGNPSVDLAQNGATVGQCEVWNGSAWAPAACSSASFYQTWTDGTFTPLPQEPFSTAGAGLSIADDPGDTATVISLPATGTAGSCTNCSVTFDLFGRETARSSGTAPVTSIGVTDPITTTGGATPTIGAKFDNVSITLNGGGGLQRAAISGDGTIGVGANTFALTNIPNDTTMAGDVLATAIAAPSTPAAGKGRIYEDSTSKNIAIKNDAGTVNHGAQTVASSAGVALTGLSDAGGWTTQTFQAPLTACTDYVSVSCQGGTSDIGTGGSNSAVQVDAFHESGGGRRPFGNFAAPGTAAVWDGTHVAGYLPLGDLGNDYTAPTVIGIHDGANVAWTTTGAAGFVAGQVVEAVAGNKITTNSMAALLIGAGLLNKTLSYYAAAYSATVSAWLATSSTAAIGGLAVVEYPLEIASVTTRVSANVIANSKSCLGGPHVMAVQLTQNGASVNAASVTDGSTGVFDSGLVSVAGATSDTWGVELVPSGTTCSGTLTLTVTATVFY